MYVSCTKTKVIMVKENYNNSTLHMDEVFIVNCTPIPNCNTDLSDSLYNIIKDGLKLLKIDVKYNTEVNNRYNDSIWKDYEIPRNYTYNKLNVDYFKNYSYNSNGLKLVPFVYYYERYGFTNATNTFDIRVYIVVFIIDREETIYHAWSWNSERTHYVKSIDDFKKEDIYTPSIIKPAIYNALTPYIKRIGNGKVITK